MSGTRFWHSFRQAFLTGLLVSIPGVVSIACVVWVFNFITGAMPELLGFLVPERVETFILRYRVLTQLVSLGLIVAGIVGVGLLTRNVFGRMLLDRLEDMLLRLPLVRPIYATVKQIAETVATDRESLFHEVVLLEFPRPGLYAIGFITAEASDECRAHLGDDLLHVFVPTTPNPTSGFLVCTRRADVQVLKMSVADAMRLIISGGVIRPPAPAAAPPALPPATTPLITPGPETRP